LLLSIRHQNAGRADIQAVLLPRHLLHRRLAALASDARHHAGFLRNVDCRSAPISCRKSRVRRTFHRAFTPYLTRDGDAPQPGTAHAALWSGTHGDVSPDHQGSLRRRADRGWPRPAEDAEAKTTNAPPPISSGRMKRGRQAERVIIRLDGRAPR
jgi:hypothetical protein